MAFANNDTTGTYDVVSLIVKKILLGLKSSLSVALSSLLSSL